MKSLVYFISSLLFYTLLSIFSYNTYGNYQIYPTLVYLTSSALPLCSLINLMAASLALVYSILVRTFLGSLTALETQHVREHALQTLFDSLLAITVFRGDLSKPYVPMIFALLMLDKVFHWIASPRVESLTWMQEEHGNARGKKIRVGVFLLVLVGIDAWASKECFYSLFRDGKPSVLIFFAFDFAILCVLALSELGKFVVLVLDMHYSGADQQWEAKPIYLFYVELACALVHLVLVLSLFTVVTSYFGLPIHLFRELYMAFHSMRDKIVRFYRYKKLVKNLQDRFPYASEEELDAVDRQCIICREEMNTGKKLPCGHIFHFNCLKSWMERSNSCPTCRAEIPSDATPNVYPAGGRMPNFFFQNQQQPRANEMNANQQREDNQQNNEDLPFAGDQEFEEFRRVVAQGMPVNRDNIPRERAESGASENNEEKKHADFEGLSQLEILQKHAVLLEDQMDLHRNSLKLLQKQYYSVIRLQQALLETQQQQR